MWGTNCTAQYFWWKSSHSTALTFLRCDAKNALVPAILKDHPLPKCLKLMFESFTALDTLAVENIWGLLLIALLRLTLCSDYREEWLRPDRVPRTTAPSSAGGSTSSTWSTPSQPSSPWSSGAWRCSGRSTRCTASPAPPPPSNYETDHLPRAVVVDRRKPSE